MGKRPRVDYATITRPEEEGGLGLISVKHQTMAKIAKNMLWTVADGNHTLQWILRTKITDLSKKDGEGENSLGSSAQTRLGPRTFLLSGISMRRCGLFSRRTLLLRSQAICRNGRAYHYGHSTFFTRILRRQEAHK